MGMEQEWEELRWEWERLLLMCSHLVTIFPPKSVFALINLQFMWYFAHFVIIWSFWCMLHNFYFD